uniref:Normal mucosa of esophagus-specific gene 1 protein-like n=1 Tax=Salmo trutta TaxID=8032 RepID=A0A674DE07_SALTR
MKNKMKFGLIQIMRRRKQVIPLMGCMALSTAGAIFASLYFLFTKNDVILNTSRNPEPWEGVDPSKPQKVIYNISTTSMSISVISTLALASVAICVSGSFSILLSHTNRAALPSITITRSSWAGCIYPILTVI